MIIAVTGGMGSGKSAIARLLGRILSSEVLSADLLCRELLRRGNPGWHEVCRYWGQRFVGPSGEIDRVVLRQAVFQDPGIRAQLEQILHPLVRQQIYDRKIQAFGRTACLVVEVPLLFEVGWQNDFDHVLAVYADINTCIQRLICRDCLSREEARDAFAVQLPLMEKCLQADSVIDNSGSWCFSVLQIYHFAHWCRLKDGE